MSPLLRKLIAHNWLLTLAMAGLLAFGIHAVAIAGEGNPSPSIQNAYRLQMVWVLIGAGIYLATSLIDYRWLVRIGAAPAWLAGIALLLCTTVLIKMKRERYIWVTLVPTAWLLVCPPAFTSMRYVPGGRPPML